MSYVPRTLVQVLADAQRRGTLGDRPVDEVIAHARLFVAALPADVDLVLDLGTGAGVPGLVIAMERPDARVVLLDRRENRMDALRRDVAALGLGERVSVLCAEAEHAARQPDLRGSCGAVVARGFGPPAATASAAAGFLRAGGVLIVSEPPESAENRWDLEMLSHVGLSAPERLPGVVRLHRTGDVSRETSP